MCTSSFTVEINTYTVKHVYNKSVRKQKVVNFSFFFSLKIIKVRRRVILSDNKIMEKKRS